MLKHPVLNNMTFTNKIPLPKSANFQKLKILITAFTNLI